ncbi:MAG: four helix bundle protein [Candidatus Peregrinibacteria bacterium]
MNVSLPIINKSYELYKHFTETNDHMTKRWRLTLGKSAELSVLSLLEQLVMAKNAPKTLKAAFLLKASGLLEVSTLKFRLMLEMNLVNETRIFQLQSEASEIGRMLGGWLKSVQSQ